MADDALRCFTSILESVPTWIADLEGILKSATERQHEMLLLYQPSQPTEDLPGQSSKRSSQCSRSTERSMNHNNDQLQPNDPVPMLLRPQLPHMTDSDALRLAQRKRKTVSVCSDNESGPSKYRSRSLVVVYYDGDAQKRFENLVRAIGVCRNAIRKGKMAAKVDSLSRCGSSSGESGDSLDEKVVDGFTMQYKSIRARRPERSRLGKDYGEQAFDKLDGALQEGQSLVEKAAHQVLRDGDCAPELMEAKGHLAEAERLAEAELPAMEKRAAKAAQRRRQEDERRQAEEEAEDRKKTADTATATKVPHFFTTQSMDGALEVDVDGDTSDGDEAELPTFSMGTYQLRSSRLLAH